MGEALHSYGSKANDLGNEDLARETLERALVVKSSAKSPSTSLAETRFALAQILIRDRTKRSRARKLAREALEEFAGSGDHADAEFEVREWLADNDAS